VATLALVEPRDACVTAPEVLVALPPEARRVFVRDADGSCAEAQGTTVQRLGEAVGLETFVSAVEHIEPRDGRIAARILAGSDGSSRIVGGFDQQRGEAARVGTAADGSRRWLPARVAFVGGGELLFAEAACSTPLATKIARNATCPLTAAVVLEGTCGDGRYFELGERVTSVYARDPANACVARATTAEVAFQLGAAVPVSAFEPVSSVDVGGARVRRRAVGSGSPVAWTEVVDAETGEPCDVLATADGTLRCLPAAAEAIAFFADSGCSEPAFARPRERCEAGASPRFVRDALDVPPRVFEVGRELAAIYSLEAGQCVPFTPSVPSQLFAASEIDTSGFATAVLAVE
jgi:hypothetical protein